MKNNILPALILLSLLTGCAQPGSGGAQLAAAQSSKPRNTSPVSSAAQQTELVAGSTTFAFDLYRSLSPMQGNLFLSPYSITTALAMTQAGARGQTLAQMNKVLLFTLPVEALHPAFNALQLALNQRQQNDQDPTKNDFRLRVTNALWGEKTYTFKADFLDLLAEHYGAGLRLLDFKTAAESSRLAINDWVSQQTEQKIKDLLAEGTVDSSTRLVLTNAIYFNASWLHPFQPGNTKAGVFTLLDGSLVQANLMTQSEKFAYSKGSGYQVIELPYQSNKLSMLIVLPDLGKFTEIEKSLNAARLETLKKELKPIQVTLSLPKFKVESKFSLADTLSAMGMPDAFCGGAADFSGMDGSRNLCISAVEHKAYVAVDENGTEAAAATAVVMREAAMAMEVVTLKINRPFLFFIQDKSSGSVLFMGRVVDPGE